MRFGERSVTFTPKGPWEIGRKSFALIKDERGPMVKGGRLQVNIKDPRLEALNKRFEAGSLSVEAGRIALKRLKAELMKELEKAHPRATNASWNLELVNAYITRIRKDADLSEGTKRSYTYAIIRACDAIGDTAIDMVSQKSLQAIANKAKSEGEHIKLLWGFRTLLDEARRTDVILKQKKYEYKTPAHLTYGQIQLISHDIPEQWKLDYPQIGAAVRSLFNGGFRLSEYLGLDRDSLIKDGGVWMVEVKRQWLRSQYVRPGESQLQNRIKNHKPRKIVPIDFDEFKTDFISWLKAHPTYEEREKYRFAIGRFIKSQCKRLLSVDIEVDSDDDEFFFNAKVDKQNAEIFKGPHMMRASHAVFLISEMGFSLDYVAKQLGDSLPVAAKHYSGIVNDKASSQNISSQLRDKMKVYKDK